MKEAIVAACIFYLVVEAPAAAQHLSGPGNVALSPNGNLYVANLSSQTVAAFKTDGTYIGSFTTTTFGPYRLALGAGYQLLVDTGNSATKYSISTYAPFGRPIRAINDGFGVGLAATAANELISIDNGNAKVFNYRGALEQNYTQDLQGLSFSGGSVAIQGETLYYATGPFSGPSYIAEYNVGKFVTGIPTEKTVFGNKGAVNPTQIAVDTNQDIYIVGYANSRGKPDDSMTKVGHHGEVLLKISGLAFPYGVTVDRSGNIYVSEADANDIKVFDKTGKLINILQ